MSILELKSCHKGDLMECQLHNAVSKTQGMVDAGEEDLQFIISGKHKNLEFFLISVDMNI